MDRCFPNKAVALWPQLDDHGHMQLVERYLEDAGNFTDIHSPDRSPRRLFSEPLYAAIGEDRSIYEPRNRRRPKKDINFLKRAPIPTQ